MRLRTRLSAVVLLAALLPAVPLTLLVRSLLRRSTGPVLQERLADGLDAGLALARAELRRRGARLLATADSLAAGGAAGVVLLDGATGRPLAGAAVPDSLAELTVPPRRPVRRGDWLVVSLPGEHPLTVLQRLPADLVDQARRLAGAASLMGGLRLSRDRVLRSYVLPFVAVYALLLAVAVLLAGGLARGVARPLEELAAAAGRVAAGDLTVRVPVRGDREVRRLIAAFNNMVAEMDRGRREVARLEKVAAWRGMARVLAHEIKNPLTPILLAVQETRRACAGGDPRTAEALRTCEEIVAEEVATLRELVGQFSAFARLPEPHPRDDDLRPLLDELSRLYGDRLEVDPPAGPLPARCDAAALRRALVNLVDNGLQACARAGRPERVAVSVRADRDAVRIAVRDHGDGVPPELRERIFEPDVSTRRDGMGLGLAIVDGIVRGHGGRVELASTPGVGSTFTIVLPRGAPPREGKETACPPS